MCIRDSNYPKKIFLLFLIFNLTFVSNAQAEATFNDINGDGTGFDVSAQDTQPRGIAFNNDGTKMFIVGDQGNDINSYTLSTGFDLSTATFNDINGDGSGFDITGQETVPRGLTFNNDGTKMFVVGDNGNDINVYTLSVGFDLTSTVTHVGEFDISDQETNPQGIAFNTTGTKMFIVGNAGDAVSYTHLTLPTKA